MATKTLNANVTITISTIQSSHPSAGSGEIWPKINVRPFFTKHRDPALTNKAVTENLSLRAAKLALKLKKINTKKNQEQAEDKLTV